MIRSFRAGFPLLLCLTCVSGVTGRARAEGGSPFAIPPEAVWKDAAHVRLAPAAPPAGGGPEEAARRVKELVSRFPAVEYNPDLRAKELGGGVEPSFQYVRDRIRFESYPGVLRGAKGAYVARAANAADRSLLLARLLNAKGINTRFALGKLPPDAARVLYARMFDAPAAAPAPANDAKPSPLPAFAQRVRARAARDYATLRGALGESFASAVPSVDDVVAEIGSHVWVQAQAVWKWVDLDTAFADAAPGKAYCTAGRTVDKLPDELHQRVTIRLVVERLDGQALVTETVLEHQAAAVDLLERQVFLVHAPLSGLKGLGASIAGGGKGWVPALWIDGEATAGKAFEYDDDDAGGAAAKLAGRLGDALDAFDTGDATPKATRQFVAERLEFEIKFPGGRTESTRRVLCDRGGDAWRKSARLSDKGLKPLPRDAGGPVAAQTIRNVWFSCGATDMSDYAVAVRMLVEAATPRPAAAAGTGAGAGQPAAAEPDFGMTVWPVALQNLSTVVWGDHEFLPALNDDPAVRLYADSPRILCFDLIALPAPDDPEKFRFASQVDLRRDRVRGVARDAGSAPAAAWRRLWYGVLEGAREHEIVAAQTAAIAGRADDVVSTSALVDERGVVTLKPDAARQPWEKLAADPEAAAELHADLSAGETLVVPQKSLAAGAGEDAGWWAVSPTGGLRAVMLGGGHASRGGRFGSGGNYIPRGAGGASPGGGAHWVDPATGAGRPPPGEGGGGGPKGNRGRGGNEYTAIILNVSLPGGQTLRITITPRLLQVTIEILPYLLP
jgi:hypothetical protein